jgi:lipoyl(octanoyl) transferase
MRKCELRDAGRISYGAACAWQKELVEQRKQGLIPDQFLIVEHPHVITIGRNGQLKNLLAGEEKLASMGVEVHHTDRGGDVTYHGPGQIVGYPILDLTAWKRDVVAYVRAVEQVLIGALSEFGLQGEAVERLTGVWVDGRKVAAIGIHISRWITSHGFALNHMTDLRYFQLIVPCGLTLPVTSMAEMGVTASRADVIAALARHFARVFESEIIVIPAAVPAAETEKVL